MTRTIARLAAGAFAWAAIAAPSPAYAQTTADSDARSEKETESAAGPSGGEAAPSAARARAGTDFFMDQISVIATRNEKQILDVPANVTVISGEKIERRMITDMQELIRHEPGIDVDRQTSATDPFNSFGGFTIRGVGGNRVQMVVDGSRVPERITDGTRDFLDLDFIKQAEIVRGPGSVLWGSDALGGVVALQTIGPEDMIDPATGFGGRVSGAYDSFNNGVDTSATLAGQLHPKVAALLGVSYDVAEEGELSRARADGGIYGCPRNLADGATPCDELDPTDETSRRALGKLVLTPAEDHRIELSADYLDRDTEVRFDQALGPQFSTTTGLPTGEIVDARVQERDLKRQRYAVEHSWDVGASFLDRLRWTAAYAPQGYELTNDERNRNAAGDSISEHRTLNYSEDFVELDVQLQSSFEAAGTEHVLTYGFDGDYTKTNYEREEIIDNRTTGARTVTRAGGFNFANAETTRADVYIQDDIGLFNRRLELLPGVRFSYYAIDPNPDADYQIVPGKEPEKVTSKEFTFKLGATFHIDDNFSVYGQYAEGFKMPTAEQLYTSLPGAFFNLIPAPDLKPEEVQNYELGFRGRFERGAFSINGFYADYENFIESFFFVPGTNDITFRNLSQVTIYGVEAFAEMALTEEVTVNGSLSWQRANQKPSPGADEIPFNVTPLTGTLGVGYRPRWAGDDLQLDVVGKFADAPDRRSDPALFRPDGYAVFDAYASYDLTETVRLTAAVLNVTNERYFEWPLPNAFENSVSDAVARSNPLELQTQPGRTFRVGIDVLF